MQKTITSFIGLDIHKDSIATTIADAGRAPPQFIGTVTTMPSSLTKSLLHVADKTLALVVYEAGPWGYGGCGILHRQGWDCAVVYRLGRRPIPIPEIGNRLLQPKNDSLASWP